MPPFNELASRNREPKSPAADLPPPPPHALSRTRRQARPVHVAPRPGTEQEPPRATPRLVGTWGRTPASPAPSSGQLPRAHPISSLIRSLRLSVALPCSALPPRDWGLGTGGRDGGFLRVGNRSLVSTLGELNGRAIRGGRTSRGNGGSIRLCSG